MKLKKQALSALEQERPKEQQLAAELEALNAFTKTPLSQEEVYLFAVRLCDNQVDRDGEFFDRAALEQLAPLFVGKSGIFDHDWSAKNQTARIYRTEVRAEPGLVPESGESFCYLKGYAYLLRREENAALIAEIEGGIKKEVSVSCAVSKKLCSVCGHEISDRLHCTHSVGQVYDGVRCAVRLSDPTDAFEWSFVAVPAQRNAGVVKALRPEQGEEKALSSALLPEELRESFARLQKEAACGRRYVEQLRGEVLHLGLLAKKALSRELLLSMLSQLEERELLELKEAFAAEAAERLPIRTQLSYGREAYGKETEHTVFCI